MPDAYPKGEVAALLVMLFKVTSLDNSTFEAVEDQLLAYLRNPAPGGLPPDGEEGTPAQQFNKTIVEFQAFSQFRDREGREVGKYALHAARKALANLLTQIAKTTAWGECRHVSHSTLRMLLSTDAGPIVYDPPPIFPSIMLPQRLSGFAGMPIPLPIVLSQPLTSDITISFDPLAVNPVLNQHIAIAPQAVTVLAGSYMPVAFPTVTATLAGSAQIQATESAKPRSVCAFQFL